MLFRSVSHELRTPLNVIIGMIDLMRGTSIDREQQEMLDSMTTASQVMLSQIEDVLDFSKIEAGKMSVENVDFDLCQLLQSIIDIFRFQINSFQIELVHSLDSEIPYYVNGDPHHLRQILVNLIGNAVKFTEQGKIHLGVIRQPGVEEKIRLRNHCDYFAETMKRPDANGKKLGFIIQEIGREINTLGSKANHASIQRHVVEMKDALEKMKEQVANVL